MAVDVDSLVSIKYVGTGTDFLDVLEEGMQSSLKKSRAIL